MRTKASIVLSREDVGCRFLRVLLARLFAIENHVSNNRRGLKSALANG